MLGMRELAILFIPLVFYSVVIALIWVFFRYFIRLVKANESISDSLEEITQLMREKNGGAVEQENKSGE